MVAQNEGIETRAAYLDLVEPDLAAVAAELVAAGHRSAVVVPLLFTSAFHATVDVPEAVAAAQASSGLELQLAEVLGTGPDVEAVLRQSLDEVEVADTAAVLLFAVGSSNAAANIAVHDLAERLGAARSLPVRVGFGTADPRASAVLAELERSEESTRRPLAVLPLFLAPGLLLDPIERRAAEHGWFVVPPLAERAAPVVARRYQDRADDIRRLQ